jgi:hypothetical protein
LLVGVLVARAAPARADDWLAVLPACVQAQPEPPRFELRYPRRGLPAVVGAGELLLAHVRLPAALTPPPGVQQVRALEGWRGELRGHALPVQPDRALEHRYALEVVDVRPHGSSSLDYRAKIPVPAWVAPGSYDFLLVGPGGSARVASSVRVLAAGATPRLAWLPDGASLASLAAAALPVDVWMSRTLPVEAHPLAAPVLVTEGAAVALRSGRELFVIGDCATEQLSFADEIGAVLAREKRARRSLPKMPALAPGQLQPWGADTEPLPPADAVSVTSAPERVHVQVAGLRAAELLLLLPADGRGSVSERGRLLFFPAGSALAATGLSPGASSRAAVIAKLAVAAPGTSLRRTDLPPLRARLVISPRASVALTPVTVRVHGAPSGSRLALRLDHLTTHFGSAPVTHRFAAAGQHVLAGWLIAPDGRVRALEERSSVQGAVASGCTASGGQRPQPGSGLWLATLILLRKRLARGGTRNRLAAPRGLLARRSSRVRAQLLMRSFLLLIFGLAGSMLGCATKHIPNTYVEDTQENREVIDFLEKYRKAVEDRDTGALLAMTSKGYFDDMGTPTGEDDVDYDGLAAGLERLRGEVLSARYQISYRGLTYITDNRVLVDLVYTGWFKVETPKGPEWRRRLEPHRIVLAREDSRLKIVSGL